MSVLFCRLHVSSSHPYLTPTQPTPGHHLSMFIEYLMTRKNIISPEGAPEAALREAVATTTYLPPEWVYDNFRVRCVRICGCGCAFVPAVWSLRLGAGPFTPPPPLPPSHRPGRNHGRGAHPLAHLVPAIRLPGRPPRHHVRILHIILVLFCTLARFVVGNQWLIMVVVVIGFVHTQNPPQKTGRWRTG